MELEDFLSRDPDGYIRIAGHRIGLHHLVFHYREGYSPEMLLEQYPSLSLAVIHKVLGFYLENRPDVDAYCEKLAGEVDKIRSGSPEGPDLAELRRRQEARRTAEAS